MRIIFRWNVILWRILTKKNSQGTASIVGNMRVWKLGTKQTILIRIKEHENAIQRHESLRSRFIRHATISQY